MCYDMNNSAERDGDMADSTTPTFSVDPTDIPAFQRWWNAQNTRSASPLHPIDIREILIGPDVLLELPAILLRSGVPGGARVLLVMDEVPMRREKQDLKPFVQTLLRSADYQVEALWLRGDTYGLVHADFEQVELVRAAIAPGTAIVALGAGSVTDIVKHATYLYEQEHPELGKCVYICCQTANSVTAFTAGMAVLFKEGVKRTVSSRYATAVISDLRVLASAPAAMTIAGLGDCCARFVAYGDWYLAYALGMVSFYSEAPLALLANLDTLLQEHAADIKQRSHESEAVIARAVHLAGIAQSIVNMSAPISGTEHVISHVLDITSAFYRRRFALHGAQVGVATLTAATLYRRFLREFQPQSVTPNTCYPNEATLYTYIRQLFAQLDPSGAMAQECWSEYRRKLALWHQQRPHFTQFCTDWQQVHRPKLTSLVSAPQVIRNILAEAGAPLLSTELEPPISAEEYDFAVRCGHFIRQRFVLSDLLYFLGWSDRNAQTLSC